MSWQSVARISMPRKDSPSLFINPDGLKRIKLVEADIQRAFRQAVSDGGDNGANIRWQQSL